MMSILEGRLESGRISGPQYLLAAVGDQHHLTLEDVHELVLRAVPVPLA